MELDIFADEGNSLFRSLREAEQAAGSSLTNLHTQDYGKAEYHMQVVLNRLQIVNDALEVLFEDMQDDSPDSLAGACEQSALYYSDSE